MAAFEGISLNMKSDQTTSIVANLDMMFLGKTGLENKFVRTINPE